MRSLVIFLSQTITASVPIAFAALGGTVSERAGIGTLALEGYLLAGAFGATVAALATGSSAAALALAAVAGLVLAAIFAWSTVTMRANAIVAGVAVNLLAAVGTRIALRVLYDSASNSPPLTIRAARVGSVARVALIEAVTQPAAWLLPIAIVGVHLVFARTVFGLRVTAAGEHPDAVRSQGLSVEGLRWRAVLLGGVLAALGGAHLALNQHEFVAYMSAGRGFLGLAAVIIGGWRPIPVVCAAVGIGALSALEASLAGRVPFPSAVLQAMPYAVTLVAVVGVVRRSRPPRAVMNDLA